MQEADGRKSKCKTISQLLMGILGYRCLGLFSLSDFVCFSF